MKQRFFRQIALILVMALLASMVGIAEDSGIGLEIAIEPQIVGESILPEGVDEVPPETVVVLEAPEGETPEAEATAEPEEASTEDMESVNQAENAAEAKYGIPLSATLGLKETLTLKCKKKNVTYKSSKPKVADVSEEGVVQGLKKGSAVITVYQGKKKLTTCKVTVVAAPKKVELGMKEATLGVKEKLTLSAKVTKGSHTTLNYTSSKPKIAEVSAKGVITAKKVGSTTITVITHNGKKVTLKVTVKKAPNKVTVNETSVSLLIGDTLQLNAQLPKKQASRITWKSSNQKVANVSENGMVTAYAEGEATITASTFNGKKATCAIIVSRYTLPVEEPESPLDSFESTLEALDQLDEDPPSIGLDQMSYDKLPTEGIKDKELLKTVKSFNTAQTDLKEAVNGFSDNMVDMSADCEKLAFAASDAGLTFTDDSLKLSGVDFTLSMDNMEYIDDNAEVLSVGASEDGSSVAIQVQSNGSIYVIQCDGKGLRVLAGNAAENAVAQHQNAVTDDVIAVQNGFWTSFLEEMSKAIATIENAVGVIDECIDDCLEAAEDALSAATKAFESADRLWAIRKANPDVPEVHLITEKQYKNAASNLNKAKTTLSAAKNFKKALGAASLYFTIKTIRETIDKTIKLGEIWNHNHPTSEDKRDPERLELANKLNANLATAELIIGSKGCLALIDLATQINDALTFAKLLLGPAGLVASLATTLGLKVTKQILIAALKKAAVDTIIGAAGEAAYSEVLALDEKLHAPLLGTVKGTVYDSKDKKPLGGVSVMCADCDTVTTDSSGQYTLSKVPEGEREIIFVKDKYDKLTKTVTVQGEVILDVFMTQSSGGVKGTVYDSMDDQPLSGVSVTCSGCDTVTTDSNGCYTLKNVSEGENKISFVKDGYDKLTKTVTVKGEVVLDVSMKQSNGNISGTVYDLADKHPMSGVSVTCPGCDATSTDSKGRYTLTDVPAGVHEISFAKEGYVKLSRKVTVKGDVSLDVYMEEAGTIPIDEEHFPDPVLRECVAKKYDKNGDMMLSETERDVEYIGCLDESIESTKGIGYFYVKEIYWSHSKLKHLDISGCNTLIKLNCDRNELVSLNAVGCTGLVELNCENNGSLNELNVEGCTSLVDLDCHYCDALTDLNISGCVNLSRLTCYNASIPYLNVSGLANLTYIDCNECGNMTKLDASGCGKLERICGYNCDKLENVNVNGCVNLISMVFTYSCLSTLDISTCANLEKLECNGVFENLDVSKCTKLTRLVCHSDNMAGLDVSNNPLLSYLGIYSEKLTSLDVSKNSELQVLYCCFSKAKSLDLSHNANLKGINLYKNSELENLLVKGLPSLDNIWIKEGCPETLDVSGCTMLRSLTVEFSKLKTLYRRNCPNLKYVSVGSGVTIISE